MSGRSGRLIPESRMFYPYCLLVEDLSIDFLLVFSIQDGGRTVFWGLANASQNSQVSSVE